MIYIQRVVPATNWHGALAFGRTNAETSGIFNELSDLVHGFYYNRNLIIIPTGYKDGIPNHDGTVSYKFPVFDPDKLEMDIEYLADSNGNATGEQVHVENSGLVGIVHVKQLRQKAGVKFEQRWDFGHAPFFETKDVFSIYFNTGSKGSSSDERDAFIRFVGMEGDRDSARQKFKNVR